MASIRELHNIETDATDWPIGLTHEQKEQLVQAVVLALSRVYPRGLPVFVLARQPEVEKVLPDAIRLAWRLAAVERACRETWEVDDPHYVLNAKWEVENETKSS